MNKLRRLPQPYIGRLIGQLRQETGLSEEEFANHFHVVSSTVNSWERGQNRPSPMTQRLIFSELRKMGDRGEAILSKYRAYSLD